MTGQHLNAGTRAAVASIAALGVLSAPATARVFNGSSSTNKVVGTKRPTGSS